MRCSTSFWSCVLAGCLWSTAGLAQQSNSTSQLPPSDAPSAAYAPGISRTSEAPSDSLADVARRVRTKKEPDVEMSATDEKELFKSVDEIFQFASEHTGYPKKTTVKRRMLSQSDLEKITREHMAKADTDAEIARMEVSLKKMGFLPHDFNLKEFSVKSSVHSIAAYYDDETKMVSMMNWISLDKQRPILAHELTHALQDQNYDLKKWAVAGEPKRPQDPKSHAPQLGESTLARRAVVEGQAQVIYIDYLLAPLGRTLRNTPGVLSSMEEPAVSAVVDSDLMHSAPYILREAGTFPYREGLIFEGELLEKEGTQGAFSGVFARPPLNSHEVLQPDAYLKREKAATVAMPDFHSILGQKYDLYDSGEIGELDVRAFLKQYDERKIADEVAQNWRGGAYVIYRRAAEAGTAGPVTITPNVAPVQAGDKNDARSIPAADNSEAKTDAKNIDKSDVKAPAPPSTADLAYMYVSHWKTAGIAALFARYYTDSVRMRYRNAIAGVPQACTGEKCPVAVATFATEEGPVLVQQWADGTVIVSESFDAATAAQLVGAVRDGAPEMHAQNSGEIASRLYSVPAFRDWQSAIGALIRLKLAEQAAGK
jgi:hypothetical protein